MKPYVMTNRSSALKSARIAAVKELLTIVVCILGAGALLAIIVANVGIVLFGIGGLWEAWKGERRTNGAERP